MLSQKVFNALNFSKLKILQTSYLSVSTSSVIPKYESPFKGNPDPIENPERQIKTWRESFKPKETIVPIEPDSLFIRVFRTKIELTPWGIKKHLKQTWQKKQKSLQQYISLRHDILGADLALAHFLVYLGGKVKFNGHDKWTSLYDDKASKDLPDHFDPTYVVSEIDATDCVLFYEGLVNFIDCPRVTRATFARCPEIDDWCIDKISSLFPFLEYLDLTDCPKVSERGLEALYRTSKLQTLIVTNNHKSAAFELTCMMLEDVVPGLQVEIRQPKRPVKQEINDL